VLDQRQAEYDQAKSEAGRTDKLLANNAISAEEAEARKSKAEVAKAALDSAKLDLDYTEVKSPIDGRVSRALLTEGNYVSGNAGSASLLTTVVSVNPVYVNADIDEDTLLKFNELVYSKKLGTTDNGKIPVELELADEDNFPHQGYIESFDNKLDPSTGSILLRAVFQNDDGRIVPGLFARIRIPLSERHNALLIDERSVGTDQANKFVLTLTSSNTVQYQAIELGPLVDGKRVVRSGLEVGEKIVVNGLARVRPGMPVTPQDETAANDSAKIAQK
jgi:RND family efflux transporter MFP subunit